MRLVNGWKRNVALNEKFLEEVDCFRCKGLHIAADDGTDREVKLRINKVEVCVGMKRMLKCRSC